MEKMIFKRAKVFFDIFKDQLKTSNFSNEAVLIAFYVLLSLFPILIVVGNIISALHINPQTVISYMHLVVPEVVQGILDPIVTDLLTSGNAGIMSISIISLLWSATQGVNRIEIGINKAYGFEYTSSSFLQRFLWIIVFIGGIFSVMAGALILSAGEYILRQLDPVYTAANRIMEVITYSKWPIAIVFILLILTLMYKFMPKTKVKFTDALPGSLFVAGGWLVLTQVFALYLKFSARSLNMYGVMSTFFILMFWLNFAAMLIIIGAVINSTVQMIRKGKLEEKDGVMDKLEDAAIDKAKEIIKKD